MNIVVSSSLEGIDPSWPFFKEPDFKRVLLVDETCPANRVKLFSKSSKVIRVTDSIPFVAEAWIEIAQGLGVRRLLVEGGGGVMWEFVRRNLIDQYYVTLTPRLLGGASAPTLVDGAGLSEKDLVDLKLTQCKRVGDELYLIYSKTPKGDR
jgi:riboflavin biosynthesis pyrimidine reductase